MPCVIWQIYIVINIDGSLTCGVNIRSAKYFFFFCTLFLKYVTRVVLKFVCTLAALFKCQPDAEFHCNVIFFFIICPCGLMVF